MNQEIEMQPYRRMPYVLRGPRQRNNAADQNLNPVQQQLIQVPEGF